MAYSLRISTKGFTLIELLVVIAIIGILASVVLASLNLARENARATSIKAHVLEFRKIMNLEFVNSGSYARLNRGWSGGTVECAARGYTGEYAQNAIDICEALDELISNPTSNGHFHTGVNVGAGLSNATQYAVMARLPNGLWFCAGSGGMTSDTTTGSGAQAWGSAGCYDNP